MDGTLQTPKEYTFTMARADKDCDVLLIYPGEPVAKPRLPMSVLALATHCASNGYRCRAVDMRVRPLEDEDIRCSPIIGISTMSGTQLNCAVAAARRIRHVKPDARLVWGGAHPSSFPQQTAESPLVDFVVKCEGEDVFLRLIKAILNDEEYSDIPSLAFRREGKVVENATVEKWMDMEALSFPRYDMLDLRRYADFEDGLSYETSRGCPYKCKFCYMDYFHRRRWRGKSVEKVTEEMRRIKEEIGVRKLFIVDDNFFGARKRALDICSSMAERGFSFKWSATARADFLSRCSEQDFMVLQSSGCEILSIGAESGSERVLSRIEKGITPDQVTDSVKKCVANGIMPTVSFVIGLPFEEDEDLEKTLDLCDELMAVSKDVEINGLFIYVPYAGTPLFEMSMEHGYRPKETLEAWGSWRFSDSGNTPWLKGAAKRRMETISSIARFRFLYHRFEFYSEEFRKQKLRSPLVRLAYRVFTGLFSRIADWRWKRRCFAFAVEWSLWRYLTYRIFKVR